MEFYTYDNREDIARCLNCPKADCTNCLGNFYSANEPMDEEQED